MRSLVSSVSYLMSFQPEEIQLEVHLSNENELEFFLQSTDEAVFSHVLSYAGDLE